METVIAFGMVIGIGAGFMGTLYAAISYVVRKMDKNE